MSEQSASRSERQGTHYEGCWRDPRHHGCAVAYIEHLTAVRSEQGTSGDEKRLDWLQRKCASIYRSNTGARAYTTAHGPGHWVVVDETARTRHGVIGKNLREAVDNAMSGERKEP